MVAKRRDSWAGKHTQEREQETTEGIHKGEKRQPTNAGQQRHASRISNTVLHEPGASADVSVFVELKAGTVPARTLEPRLELLDVHLLSFS